MTKRLARLILFAVWATLVAGSVIAYVTTRAVLIADLDARLMEKAASLPQIIGEADIPPPAYLPEPNDRFIIENFAGQTLARARNQMSVPTEKPALIRARFVRMEGTWMRSVTIRAVPRVVAKTPTLKPNEEVTVIYSGSAERLNQLLTSLAVALIVFDVIGGAAAWMMAMRLSKTALRPLTGAAEVIGTIDETHLDRRIETNNLPDELMPVATRLNELLNRLQEAFSARRQFLADASHELRTPVAALVTTMEVALRRPREASEYRSTFETCLTEANMLKQLVQRLMEQARSEQFGHDEEPSEINISQLLDECAAAAASLGAPAGIQVIRRYGEDLTLVAQRNRLHSVVMNLLGNAVEYNIPGGTIEVIGKMPADRTRLDLTIRDTGKGISPDNLPRVFEPFYRADTARKHDPSHLGLGLFLARSHIRAMHGEIRAESTLGAGTSFHLWIPDARKRPDYAVKSNETVRNNVEVQTA